MEPDYRAVVDTETMSFRTDSVILSVGVVIFDLHRVDTFSQLLSQGKNILLEKERQLNEGRHVDEKDVMPFWRKQSVEAAQCVHAPESERTKLEDLVVEYSEVFSRFSLDHMQTRVYCRGPQFDVAKLEDLAFQFNLKSLWHYRKPRCSRTFLDEHSMEDHVRVKRPSNMISHNSLHDSAFEAYLMQRMYNGIVMDLA